MKCGIEKIKDRCVLYVTIEKLLAQTWSVNTGFFFHTKYSILSILPCHRANTLNSSNASIKTLQIEENFANMAFHYFSCLTCGNIKSAEKY